MRSDWPTVQLGSICEFKYGKSLRETDRTGTAFVVYGSNGPVGRHDHAVTDGPTIVVGRKGSLGEVHYSDHSCWPIDTTYFIDLSATNCDLRWLFHRLRGLGLTSLNRSAAVPGLNRDDAYRKTVLLPPLAEQRRIAEVLDRAEALRAKRRAALAQLDTLTQSIFLDMFGDPATNPKGWPTQGLRALLAAPLRNGRSPSSTGTVAVRVLTLSAVTGSSFDADAWKIGQFPHAPSAEHLVNARDLLICRGNGNLRLVGRGFFPLASATDLMFPDTMIAARVAEQVVEPAFLEEVWNSPAVRSQIESHARTTNGTYKVNQEILETVRLVVPPLHLQRAFAARVAAVEKMKAAQRAALAALDALFAALQHRAFRGEL